MLSSFCLLLLNPHNDGPRRPEIRMQYHTLSLLQAGHDVTVIGYTGEQLIEGLVTQEETSESTSSDKKNNQLQVIRFAVPNAPSAVRNIQILYLLWRMILLTIYLCHALFVSVKATRDTTKRKVVVPVDCVLIQNPPAVPSLAVAALYCHIQHAGLVIDWHNLGYSMFTSSTKLQQIVKRYEAYFARFANHHLCVTHAMKRYLQQEFSRPAATYPFQFRSKLSGLASAPDSMIITTFHDCPPHLFQPLTIPQQHAILLKMQHSTFAKAVPQSWLSSISKKGHEDDGDDDSSGETLFTITDINGTIVPRPGRPALITSSTSWTPDEDFAPMLEACQLLEDRISQTITTATEISSSFKILVVVTGKGPQKEYYQEQISKLALLHVCITTVWLEPDEYPQLIACADVGISLHTSTSSLDLPMKILDLFGCHVPVVARKFACLDELVKDGHNGRTFDTSQQLADHLWNLLQPLSSTGRSLRFHEFGDLGRYSANLKDRPRWERSWAAQALPAIEQAAAAAAQAQARRKDNN
jgi:beta-1,4-mannosyltransferase